MSIARKVLMTSGGKKDPTYVDDVFSTYLYRGNNAEYRSIVNGVDNTEGGLLWVKRRESSGDHILSDSVTGITKHLISNSNSAQTSPTYPYISSLQNNGFTLRGGTNSGGNISGREMSSWNFRKAPGFFDVVTYTGNGATSRTLSHSLGSKPGFILVKDISQTGDWTVYHTSLGAEKWMVMNSPDALRDNTQIWRDTEPTDSELTIGAWINTNGDEYVVYLFAGGESTAATARSVSFNGSSAYLSVPDTDGGWDLGTSDFTIETWLRFDGSSTTATNDTIFDGRHASAGVPAYYWLLHTSGKLIFGHNTGNFNDATVLTGETVLSPGIWYHAAVSKSGSTIKFFLNGVEEDSTSDTRNYTMGFPNIGWRGTDAVGSSLTYWNGLFSNFRIVKGTAVYTSSFKPPTEPLTNITNTSLLFCNNSSVTGSTVTTGTITATGSPVATTDSPFDDPAGFVFGENGDQSIIKCGVSRAGSGGTVTAEDIGWEPQWLLQKQTNDAGSWFINDSMMGWDHSGFDYLRAESTNAEANQSGDKGYPTSQGFKFPGGWWSDTNVFIWIAIRRPDGYVGKPPETGTGVFAMDTGNSSSTIPCFVSGFPVDFALHRDTTSTQDWYTAARLTGTKWMATNASAAESTSNLWVYDSNIGWCIQIDSARQSWMWKRHAGFDVVTIPYTQSSSSTLIHSYQHNLNAIPEMIWFKSRDTGSWYCYHKGQNGGSSPWDYALVLNANSAEANADSIFGIEAPTSTHFGIKASQFSTGDYIAMLFASVEGISKCGYYDGSNSTQTITVGFQPRFVIIKKTNASSEWVVLDTTRGWGAGNDNWLQLDSTAAQVSSNMGAPTSTGFTVNSGVGAINDGGKKYIYYAHA